MRNSVVMTLEVNVYADFLYLNLVNHRVNGCMGFLVGVGSEGQG